MFKVIPKRDCDAVVLRHSDNIFHEALPGKDTYYHVLNDGRDYDILYIKNNDMLPEKYRSAKKGIDIYPSYLDYDENDVEKLDLSLLKEHSAIYFYTVNEYSVCLARLALKYTEDEVYFCDSMAEIFLEENERLHIGDEFPETFDDTALQIMDEPFLTGYFEGNFHKISSVPAFHSVFFWQSLYAGSAVKYVEVSIAKNVGIGGILSYYAHAREIFAGKGLGTYLKENCTRYEDEMLRHYFNLDRRPEDADSGNTAFLTDISVLQGTYLYSKYDSEIDTDILTDEFRNEMNEYREAVLGDKNVLGVLIRGTDYVVLKMGGIRQMATVDDMLPMIHEWMDADHYDFIFLATEDQDVLDQMRSEFGSKLRAVSQVRHSVRDFGNAKLLSELEKREEQENNGLAEDNTVNYFYALYILSHCRSFMASGNCHGWNVVNSFKKGDFKRCYKFQVGVGKEDQQ